MDKAVLSVTKQVTLFKDLTQLCDDNVNEKKKVFAASTITKSSTGGFHKGKGVEIKINTISKGFKLN